ncbi:MAG: cytochrome c3 family protein, partial [Limisphaerales bacterium]
MILRWSIIAFALAAAAALAALQGRGRASVQTRLELSAKLAVELPRLGRTNGYVASGRCQACHPDQYATWHQSYHRTMTQIVTPETVVGRFDGTTVESGGRQYRVGREGDSFWAEMPDPDVMMYVVQGGKKLGFDEIPRVRLPVVMATGSHHYQTYWVASPRYDRLLQTLPLVYLIGDDRWIPREEAFMRGPNDTEPFVTQWNHHCIRCHSTGGNPGLDAKGQLNSEVGELGIACEACHGPGEEHARRHQNPVERYAALLSKDPDPTIVNPARLDHRRSSEVCGLCHGVHKLTDAHSMEFARNGPLFTPGEDLALRRYIIQHPRTDPSPARIEEYRKNRSFFRERWWDDGTILAGGREHAGISVSACYQRGEMSCLSCHTMHGREPDDQLKPGMRGSEACTSCHKEPKYNADVVSHTFHRAGSSGSECMNCHMPHTSYALLKGIRSHQIESPRVRSSVRYGLPNACNLCHLDRTLAWTGKHLADWYGQAQVPMTDEQKGTSAALLWLLKGHAAQRAIASWHLGWGPALEASGSDWLAPFQAQLLADPYGVVRYVAAHRLRELPGFEGVRIDFLGSTNEWKAEAARVQREWKTRTPRPSRKGSE